MGPDPYFFLYADTNCGFPGDFSSANQSPAPNTPSTLFAPILSGKLMGSLAPLERNRNFGLKLCSIIALARANASSTWVPPTTMSGCAAAIFETIDGKSFVSGGYTCLKTVWIPAASNFWRTVSAMGDAKGSSSSGYAALFGR